MKDQITCDEYKYVVEMPPLSVMHMFEVFPSRSVTTYKYNTSVINTTFIIHTMVYLSGPQVST